ncbi:fucolectin-like [Rhineura floridana]|uniref:fucolectin-like n=1 Tax=Rhineura floridana TaxID=261503 RepID=UPI002AC87F24|nr:fucolectin-like [Rhineura floridana]
MLDCVLGSPGFIPFLKGGSCLAQDNPAANQKDVDPRNPGKCGLALSSFSLEDGTVNIVLEAHNLAKDRPGFQSSLYPHPIVGAASKAVDGNCGGDWFKDGSCTHTGFEMEPWWYVDLGDQYAISAVVVKNRGDCCGERLQGAQIRVGDSVADHGKSSPLSGTITDTRLGSVSTLYCNWLKGRYVSIRIPGWAEFLHVCEVEVYGTKPEDTC